jgi:hypothetical protein
MMFQRALFMTLIKIYMLKKTKAIQSQSKFTNKFPIPAKGNRIIQF